MHAMDSSSTSINRAAVNVSIKREHMFDKVVTPSDVGKLNRLVIPKQHAEKYFPLNSPSIQKGLLLNFEDKEGKTWRFRYSYWNSSQSYVITKGWSRFVKEKQLHAGDIVLFEREVKAIHRFFIGFRHRDDVQPDLTSRMAFLHRNQLELQQSVGLCCLTSPMHNFQRLNFNNRPYFDQQRNWYNEECRMGNYGMIHHHMGRIQHGVVADPSMVLDSVPLVQGNSQTKRIRLFGVNMECPISDDEIGCNMLNSKPILHDHHIGLPLSSHHDDRPPAYFSGELSREGKSSLSLDLDL